GIARAVSPQFGSYEACPGASGRCAHGHVRHENDLGAEERSCAHVLDHVVVVADQYPALPSAQLEHRIRRSGLQVPVDERVNLTVLCDQAIPAHADITVIELAVLPPLEEAGENNESVPPGNRAQRRNALPGRYGFGQVPELLPRQPPCKGIPGNGALMEGDHVCPTGGSAGGELLDGREVEAFIAAAVLELRGRDHQVIRHLGTLASSVTAVQGT